MTIHLLDDHTINQMAAGEVIENTASVIKELVENAIDANATSIEIEVLTGGRSYIRVSDNGVGILHDEVPKAILRHATSKLRTYTDLHALHTLGFRGEALASIASISKLTITTSTTAPQSNSPNGTFFVAEGGKIVTHIPVFREKGTSVEVKELFFNTPVRKSFQRSSTFDTQDILKMLTHLSLGYPEISFRFVADKKVLLDLYPSDLKERSTSLLGKNFTSKTTEIFFEKEGIKVQGLVGDPQDHRHNRMGQYLLVNKRGIHSSLVAGAVKEGYGHALPEGRFPQFVIHLELDPANLDVNVHPQKREARFRSKGNLAYTLTQAVQAALFKQREPIPTPNKMVWNSAPAPLAQPLPWEETFSPSLFTPQARILQILPGYLIVDSKSCPALFDSKTEGLGVINTILAFELLFQLKDLPQYGTEPLLIPMEMEVSVGENHAFEEVAAVLKSLGIEATPFSEKTILLHSLPNGMGEEEAKDLVREIFARWQENLPQKKIARLGHLFGKKKLTQQEAIYLIQKLEKHPDQKGVASLITKDTLDRWL